MTKIQKVELFLNEYGWVATGKCVFQTKQGCINYDND
jgi:hypothetical protein